MSEKQLIILKDPPTLAEMREICAKIKAGYYKIINQDDKVTQDEVVYIQEAYKLSKATLANHARHHLS